MAETTAKYREIQQNQGFSPSRNFGAHSENGPQMAEIYPEITFSEAQKIIEGYQDENFVLLESWQRRIYNLNLSLATVPALPFAWFAFESLLTGLIVSSVGYLISYFVYKKGQSFLASKTIECYANIKENIYVYHERPKDTTVLARKKYHAEMLEQAKNLTPIPVQVIDIYFRIGKHCNETWDHEWPARLISEIQKDRSNRHKRLAKDYPLLYKKYILKQEMD